MPNNGTKIYTETINGVKYGIDLIADVYKVLGVSPTQTGGAYCDLVCANKHGKINKFAKYKPYRIDTIQDPTEAQRKEINYGLGIKYLVINSIKPADVGSTTTGVLDWTPWAPPVPGTDWHRPTDFDGYNHKAVPFVKSLKIYSSAGQQYHRPIYTVNSQGEPYLIAELDLEPSINAEIRYADLSADSGNTPFNKLYLTMLLISQDAGGDFHYAAQSERPITEEVGRASVIMYTGKIPNLSAHQDDINAIVVCLAPHMTIAEDHTYSGGDLPSTMVSLDINALCFQHILVNAGMAQYANGSDGGAVVITLVDVYGRFAANPLAQTGITVQGSGEALLQIVGDNGYMVTWAGTSPSGYSRPTNMELLVTLTLTKSGSEVKNFTWQLDFDTNDDTGASIMDNHELRIPSEGLSGTYTAKLTLSVGVKQQGATTTYSFKDADNHANALQKVVNLSNVTFY